jgi:glycine hydroxymethyltransferase
MNIKEITQKEYKRQQNTLNLIASENYPSKAVLEPLSSSAVFKYAEGYPDNRYYAGCTLVDEIEKEAILLAKKLFKADFANVQAHSGSNANMAVYFALLSIGDKVLAPDLSCGGHLTHGSKASITSKLWQFKHYGLSNKNELDYKAIEKEAKEFKPKLIIAGTSAYPLKINWKEMKKIADSVGALLMADIAHLSGLIAGDVIENPLAFVDVATLTTQKTLRGPRGGVILTNNGELAKKIDKAVFPNLQGGPHMQTIASKAVCFKEALGKDFKKYSKQVVKNAKILHKTLKDLGVSMWTEDTDTHLTNIDTMKSFSLTGLQSEKLLESQNIIVNREAIPFDTLNPKETSGIRVGTPALTTRGMKENEMKKIAKLIFEVLKNKKDVKKEVSSICKNFPIKR